MDFALIHKERRQVSTQKRDLMLVGDVRGKECILIDDICDTSYTITRAARMLRENGALKVYAIVCHAILSGSALENIEKSDINQIVVSNSIPQNEHLQSSKIKVFDVAPLFAEAIRRIHFGESVSTKVWRSTWNCVNMTVSDFLRSPFEIDILHFDCFGIEEIPSFDEHLIFSSAG